MPKMQKSNFQIQAGILSVHSTISKSTIFYEQHLEMMLQVYMPCWDSTVELVFTFFNYHAKTAFCLFDENLLQRTAQKRKLDEQTVAATYSKTFFYLVCITCNTRTTHVHTSKLHQNQAKEMYFHTINAQSMCAHSPTNRKELEERNKLNLF